jgi:aspartyl-tRNA(Asn)/glutamyl-tRNA(Gln) amidotransferase subunit B
MISQEITDSYEVIIGIECHVQLATQTKLFCGCDNNARGAEPNTRICPVCLGMPGTLPVLNAEAVNLGIRAGLALNGEIGRVTNFDRKNYFYPDLPKGYQITQFDLPIVGIGKIDVPLDGSSFEVGITRAHMEEDAGKLTHPVGKDYSLVDLNRAGTPLLEIVSEPDMRSAAQAKAYAQELYNLMRYAKVSDVDLYHGNMRFDINVSVRKYGAAEFGTRTETKNLNSFKAIERTVEYEVKRQIELIEKGETIVQETRGWDEAKQKTFSQRTKEDAHDYRYFPEPDVPPIVVTDEMMDKAQAELPALPPELRIRLREIGLPEGDIETLIARPELLEKFFEATQNVEAKSSKRIANWLVNEEVESEEVLPNPMRLAELSVMVDEGKLSSTNAKEIFREVYVRDIDPMAFAEEHNLIQNSDTGAMEAMVDQVIADNPSVVEEYKAGKQQVFGFLVGSVMKASKGQANPAMVSKLLREKLKGDNE